MNTTTRELPVKVVNCGSDWTEPTDYNYGTAASLEEAKVKVAEDHVVMDSGDELYQPYGNCEITDSWDGEESYVITIADESILDENNHVTI